MRAVQGFVGFLHHRLGLIERGRRGCLTAGRWGLNT